MKKILEPKNLFFIALGLVILLPSILTLSGLSWFDFKNTGQIGDTIGGIAAPIIGLLSAWLVYKSFEAQVEANVQLKNQIAKSHEETNFLFATNEVNTLENRVLSFAYNNETGKKAIDNFIQNLDTHLDVRKTYGTNIAPYAAHIKLYEEAAYRFDILLFNHSAFTVQLKKLSLSKEHMYVISSKYYYYYKINLAELSSAFDKYLVLKELRTDLDNNLISILDRIADVSKKLKEWSEELDPAMKL